VESSKYDTAASNSSVFLGFGSVEASNALNYASRFSSYGSVESAAANFVNRNHGNGEKIAVIDGTGKRPFEERNPAVSVPKSESLDSSVRFSPEKTPPQLSVQTADASKRARTPSTLSGLDTTAGSRSYRQQTSELINKLDKLLKFPTKPGSNAGSGNKAARGSGGKGRSRRPPRDLAKPRARNVVLKQAAELIWRIKCDEQAFAMHRGNAFVASKTEAKERCTPSPCRSPATEEAPPAAEVREEKPLIDAAAAAAALNSMDCDSADAEVFLTKWVASIRPAAAFSATTSSEIARADSWQSPASPLSADSPGSSLDIIEHDDSSFQWGTDAEYPEAATAGGDAATAALRWHLRWTEDEEAPADDGLSCGAALSLFLEQQHQQPSMMAAPSGRLAEPMGFSSPARRGASPLAATVALGFTR